MRVLLTVLWFSDQRSCFVRVLLTGAVCVCGSVFLGSATMLCVGLADWDCVCVCVRACIRACVFLGSATMLHAGLSDWGCVCVGFCGSQISDHASCGSC